MYQGQFFQVKRIGDFADLVFDSQIDALNIMCKEAVEDLEKVTAVIKNSDVKGVVLRSNKKIFCGGANVKAFRDMFEDGTTREYLAWVQSVYNAVEDLDIPKVTIVNGLAAGGGCELTLLSEYRLATPSASFLMPEVKYGIMPAWGGMTRMPRLLGLDVGIKWLTTGKMFKAQAALTDHLVDGIIDPKTADPLEKAIGMLEACVAGQLDWRARRDLKLNPLGLSGDEITMSLTVAGGMIAKAAGKHYPSAPLMMKTYPQAIRSERDKALTFELDVIDGCVKSGIADALVSILLNDLEVKGKAKAVAKGAQKTEKLAVIGAGIMGGGIAYTSASKNIEVAMKDINDHGLNLGLAEASKLLVKQLEKGRIKPAQMAETLNRIRPTLHNAAIDQSDLVVEAVVENIKVKHAVLTELEQVAPNAVIASNTSTIPISQLAEPLQKPENFCGIHFFNPVHMMPLVEVIRGEQTSDETIAKAVSYALQLGKVPVVVNDCAGFLVNRVLMPYFIAFNQLMLDGADLAVVDKVMSKQFGFPMGPGHLLDVIGLDTAAHCLDTMADAYPDRMAIPEVSLVHLLNEQNHLGQKTGRGFYQFTQDRRGRLVPSLSPETQELIAQYAGAPRDFSEAEIIDRLMTPMLLEAIRCLDEKIVASPAEADIAFINGIGFPPFRGGVFYYADRLGSQQIVETAKQYQQLGGIYAVTESMAERSVNNAEFYA